MKRLLAVIACGLLQACAVPKMLPAATQVRAGETDVVVIGKIELVPPIDAKHEQAMHWNVLGEQRLLSRVWMATGAQDRPVHARGPDAAEFQATIEASWGVPFMVRAPRQRTYLNGAFAHLDVIAQERLWFPGGLYFDVPPQAAAVYIGTLRYYRNDFNVVTRIEVVDDQQDAAAVLPTGTAAGSVTTSLLKRVH